MQGQPSSRESVHRGSHARLPRREGLQTSSTKKVLPIEITNYLMFSSSGLLTVGRTTVIPTTRGWKRNKCHYQLEHLQMFREKETICNRNIK